jgi:PAS domain-containing protein/DNA-binding CsgD family transcriptional regulator
MGRPTTRGSLVVCHMTLSFDRTETTKPMDEVSQAGEMADRHARWVKMWREAVRASRIPMGLTELSTTRFIELSVRAAELLGTTPEAGPGLNYLSVAERPRDAAETFRLAQEGMIDGIRARRRLRRPDGSMVEVESSGWAIRSPAGPDLGLWAAYEVSETDDGERVEVVSVPDSGHHVSSLDGARVTLDYGWRMADISTDAASLLGRTPVEVLATSILDLTHPGDLAALLFGFARATSERGVSVRIRLRHHDGSWRTSRAAPTVLDGDGTVPFSLVMTVDDESEGPDPNSDITKLANDLRRVAAQIEAADRLGETANSLGVAVTTELSARQWEVVSYLVRGERVPTIAAKMYLSQSTVRNHLSAIFRKVGVHSQQEFLALWALRS